MKRKNTTDLRAFLARAAAKKKKQPEPQPEPEPERESVTQPSSNESQMQMVVFQGQSDSGTNTTETPITEDDQSILPDESEGSDSDDDNSDEYNLEQDPGLRAPISSYPVNDQDSVRRAYIALGPCRPRMKSFSNWCLFSLLQLLVLRGSFLQ